MRPTCTVCGRRTTPFLFIGNEPVGPTCAKRMGFTRANAPKGNRVRFVDYKPKRAPEPERNLDLFDPMYNAGTL